MRLIDADALLAEYDRVHVGPPGGARKLIEDAPTIEAGVFPCPIGSDIWWVDPETNEVSCDEGAIQGFAFHSGKTFAVMSKTLDMVELHDPWCCLSKEEAESFIEK